MNNNLNVLLEKIIAEYRIKVALIEEMRDEKVAKFQSILYEKSIQELKAMF